METLKGIGEHVVSAILIGLFLYLWQLGRYCFFLRRKFHNACFDVYYKGKPDIKVRTVTLQVKGHTIYYNGEQIRKGGEGTFSGELINPLNLRTGEGVHLHDGYEGFNLPKLIIKDNDTFFIEDYYYSNRERGAEYWNFNVYYQAYIWRRNKG
jgi:hypothetical protein